MSVVSNGWQAIRSELRGNAKVRIGCWLIFGMVWGYCLLVNTDRMAAANARIEELDAELARLKPVFGEQTWPARTTEAKERLTELRALLWSESSSGLAQAEVQDWLRQVSVKAGLAVKDLRLTTSDNAAPSETSNRTARTEPSPGTLPLNAVKARLTVEFKPLPLAALLNEIAVNPRTMVVERLQLRTWNQTPQAELDIRVPVSKAEIKAP